MKTIRAYCKRPWKAFIESVEVLIVITIGIPKKYKMEQ